MLATEECTKHETRTASACIATVDFNDAVFEREAAQVWQQRLAVEHSDLEPARGDRVALGAMQPQGAGAFDVQDCVGSGAIVDFDQKHAPALFDQFSRR